MNVRHVIWASIVSTTISCQSVKKEYNSFDEYPVYEGKWEEMTYSPAGTHFSLWAPTAQEVRVMLYEKGQGGAVRRMISMQQAADGMWQAVAEGDLKGSFYAFNVKIDGIWQGDTPGVMATVLPLSI